MNHPVATKEDWLEARQQLLAAEKELTRQRDAVAAQRRALPWVRVENAYRFHTEQGTKSLAELFDGRSQLAVYHFMLGPGWDAGCPSCSLWADASFHNISQHLAARDVSFVAISSAPLETLLAYKRRMDWRFEWVSSAGTQFNRDFHVSFTNEEKTDATYNYRKTSVGNEMPGASMFARQGEQVFHTYSTYSRGLDALNAAYQWLDLAPKGRDEAALAWSMEWVRRHDEYTTDS